MAKDVSSGNVEGLQKRVKILTRKNEDLEKKLKAAQQSSNPAKGSDEVHKLKLKIISLEKSNEFLIAKSKALEASKTKTTGKAKKGKKKKKKVKKKTPAEVEAVLVTEGEDLEKVAEEAETPVKVVDEVKADYSDDEDEDEEASDKENNNGVINIPTGALAGGKKKKKTGGRKKVALKFETIVVRISKILSQCLLKDSTL
jgi:hypothetical protein